MARVNGEPKPPIDHVWGSLALALVSVLGIIVLAAMHITPPTTLDTVAVGSAIGGAALSRRGTGG